MQYKYLIVGQGLAGTILSFKLSQKAIPHKVMDNGHKTAATLAAAGIINPITGRRYVKSWMIDDLLPAARETYAALSKLLNIELFKESVIFRTFADQAQENQWNESTSRLGYRPYVGNLPNPYEDFIEPPYGYGVIQQVCQVDVAQMIIAYQKELKQQGLLIEQAFDHSQFDYDSEEFRFADDAFLNMIFCEGYSVIHNPLFENLPFQPAKGESLSIQTKDKLPTSMLRDKIFIAPTDSHTCWTGGGYQWDDFESEPTEKFFREWTDKLDKVWKGDYDVLSHRAGVRPSVKGRRPLIGRHPRYNHIILFNGMGTKGTSLAPYWAEHLITHLEQGERLSEEVSLGRF